jgi:hypothetical protein
MGTGAGQVIALVDEHLEELSDLCRRYQVERLDLFGSAATGELDPAAGDLDFIVAYGPNADLGPWAARHYELRDALAELFGRPVDLIMDRRFRNPHFRRSVEASRMRLYAA